jgi:hypothetical protein
MANILFQLDAASAKTFSEAIEKIRSITGQTLGEALREEAGIEIDRAQQLTPPKNLQQGKLAVKGDIKKIAITRTRLIEILKVVVPRETRRVTVWEHIPMSRLEDMASKYLKIRGGKLSYGLTRDELHTFHEGQRGSRGRVKSYHGTMVSPGPVIDAYILEIQQRVGGAKGGWNAGMLALGRSVPDWVGRHGITSGSFEDKTDGKGDSLFFTATNSTPYAEYLDNELQILEKAQHGRLEALRDKVVIYLEKGIGK